MCICMFLSLYIYMHMNIEYAYLNIIYIYIVYIHVICICRTNPCWSLAKVRNDEPCGPFEGLDMGGFKSFSPWLVGGEWLPSIFNFPINIGFRLSSQLTNSYFSEGFKPPTRWKTWDWCGYLPQNEVIRLINSIQEKHFIEKIWIHKHDFGDTNIFRI